MLYDEAFVRRFWSQVSIPSSEFPRAWKNKCWLWAGATRGPSTDDKGKLQYGRVTYCGVKYTVSRVSWELAHNERLPADILVLHTCDTPLCVNPDHLVRGSHADNVADRVSKGRSAKGLSHPKTRLKEEDVLEIVRLKTEEGWTYKRIANKYAVGTTSIQHILEGKNWQHLTGIPERPKPKCGRPVGAGHHNSKLNPDKVREIRRLFAEGSTLTELGDRFGVHKATISGIVRRKEWSHVE